MGWVGGQLLLAGVVMPVVRAELPPHVRGPLIHHTARRFASLANFVLLPVLLVTGDEASCREGRQLLGDGLTTVPVKRAFGSGAARMIPPVRARRLIEEGAKEALGDLTAVPPYDPGSPCEIKVEFKRTTPADRLRFHPGVERLDGRTIRAEAPTWWDAWQLFFFAT